MADEKKRKSQDESPEDSMFNILGEGLKKIVATGISAAFLTEESIRTYLGELKLPKELLNSILQSASKSKEQLMNRVGNEMTNILSKIDYVKEFSRFVENHKFKIQAEIEILKKKSPLETDPEGHISANESNLKTNIKMD
jgi:polyhydroxyalkanoate synthesis regulator phasin